jgi:hypothetical protein
MVTLAALILSPAGQLTVFALMTVPATVIEQDP